MLNLEKLLTSIKAFKSLYIVFSPNLDSIHTAYLLYRLIHTKDYEIDVQIAPFYRASKPNDTGSTVLIVGTLQRPVPGYRILNIDDYVGKDPRSSLSLSLYTVKELKNYWIIPRLLEVLSISAMLSIAEYSTYDTKLVEAHRELLENAVSKDFWSYVESFRFFGYPKTDIATALERTIEPYILGYSLDPENSRRIVEEFKDLSKEEQKKKFIETVMSIVLSYSSSKEAASIYDKKIVVKNVDEVDDVYEAFYILTTFIDVKGVEPLIYLYIEPEFFKYIKSVYLAVIRNSKEFLDSVVKSRSVRKNIVKGMRINVIDISAYTSELPLYTVYRVLRGLGICDAPTVFYNGKEYLLPVQFVEPRWPLEKELNIEKNYVVMQSLQDVGDVVR